jgi:hypothetical protein
MYSRKSMHCASTIGASFNRYAFVSMKQMSSSRKMLIAAVLAAGLGAGAAGVRTTFAAETTQGKMHPLIEAIATKFNLDVADVQKVFDEQRASMQAEHEARENERLAQLVADGKLTQDQVDLIIAKRAELKESMEAMRNPDASLPKDERREVMKSHMESIKQWAEENDIPFHYLHVGLPAGMHEHGGMMGEKRGLEERSMKVIE